MSTPTITLAARQALNNGKRSRAGALGLLYYEHLITFDKEVDFIWSKPWTFVHFIYVFNGWFSFAWLLFDTIPLTTTGVVKSHICVMYLLLDDVTTLVSTVTVQIILEMRVWALYERSRKMLLFLVIITALEVVTIVILLAFIILKAESLNITSTPTGCALTGAIPTKAVLWIPALILEPILCMLVLCRSWRTLGSLGNYWTANTLVAVVARDSIMYFVVIFLELLVSTIIWAKFPIYIQTIMPWSTAIPALLGNRLLINMKEKAEPFPMAAFSDELTTVEVSHGTYVY